MNLNLGYICGPRATSLIYIPLSHFPFNFKISSYIHTASHTGFGVQEIGKETTKNHEFLVKMPNINKQIQLHPRKMSFNFNNPPQKKAMTLNSMATHCTRFLQSIR